MDWIAATAGSPGQPGCTESTLRTTRSPEGEQPTTSVKVPPRSSQKLQRPPCLSVVFKLEGHVHVLRLEQLNRLLKVIFVLAGDAQAFALDRHRHLL